MQEKEYYKCIAISAKIQMQCDEVNAINCLSVGLLYVVCDKCNVILQCNKCNAINAMQEKEYDKCNGFSACDEVNAINAI